MHVIKKFLVLSAFTIIVVCKAEYDSLDRLSLYVRTSSKEIADKLSYYYQKYTKEKPEIKEESYVAKRYDENDDYRADDEIPCDKKLQKCLSQLNDISDEAFSRRVVNMLLMRTDFEERDSSFHGRVVLEGTASDLKTLKNFGLGILPLREVAPILNNMIKSGESDIAYDFVLWTNSLTPQLFNFIETYKYSIIIFACVLYLFQALTNMECDVWLILSIGLAIVFIVNFGVVWREAVQEESEKNMENPKEMPIHCKPNAMRWTDKLMALVSSAEDCEKYKNVPRKNHPVPPITLTFFRTVDRVFQQVLTLSIKMAFILIQIMSKYLPLLGLLIVQNIIALKEYSIGTLVGLVLTLFCCYFYCSTRIKRSKPRHRPSSKNERYRPRFIEQNGTVAVMNDITTTQTENGGKQKKLD